MPGQFAAFMSARLPAPVQLTGSATVRLRVTAPAGATLFAKLYDVDQARHRYPPGTGRGTRAGRAIAGRAGGHRAAGGDGLRLLRG